MATLLVDFLSTIPTPRTSAGNVGGLWRMTSSHEPMDVRPQGRPCSISSIDRRSSTPRMKPSCGTSSASPPAWLTGDDFDVVAVRSSCEHWGAGILGRSAAVPASRGPETHQFRPEGDGGGPGHCGVNWV